MAKRENFKISYNGKEVIKHKWNSACREVERIVGEIAKEEKTNYHLINSVSNKVDFYFETGSRTWKGENGNVIKFKIAKEL